MFDEVISIAESELKRQKTTGKQNESFTLHIVPLQKGDVIYMFTDGVQDQFSGWKNKKFMVKNLKELLLSMLIDPCKSKKLR